MAHFGSGNWPQNYGPIPYSTTSSAFSKQASALPLNLVATNVGVTEGSDLATFTLPDAGLYRVTAFMEVNVASDAGTETGEFKATYTDATGAHSNIALNNQNGATTNTTLNLKAAVGTAAHWMAVVRGTAAGTIAVNVQNIIGTSVRTVGKVNLNVVVEKIGE